MGGNLMNGAGLRLIPLRRCWRLTQGRFGQRPGADANERMFVQKENDQLKFGYSRQFLDAMRDQSFGDEQHSKVSCYNQKIGMMR
jgi:hypothetical protein